MIAIAMPAGVVPASVATMAPRIVASAGRSWNHNPGFFRGYRYMGATTGARWGLSVVCPPEMLLQVSLERRA